MGLVITARACVMVMLTAVATVVVALWVTRGDRKYTPEGEQELVTTFKVGYLIIILIIAISALANVAW